MTSYFTNTEPNAQKKTKKRRLNSLTEFTTFVTSKFPARKKKAVAMSCFGGDSDEQQIAQDIYSSPTVATTDSEALGDAGGIYLLQKILEDQDLEYDDSQLHLFSGANTFNLVYIDGPLSNPKSAIVLENKGGTSQLGSRTDKATGTTVTQGTAAYFDVEVALMLRAKNHLQKNQVAAALQALRALPTAEILYAVVRTVYKKKTKTVTKTVKKKGKKTTKTKTVTTLDIYDPVVEHTLAL